MTSEPTPGRLAQVRDLLGIVASVAIILLVMVMLWRVWDDRRAALSTAEARSVSPTSRRAGAVPTEPLSLTGAAIKGSTTAKVAILEFSDFQCPYCARFSQQTLPKLEERYLATGKVLFAFRHMPLESIHPLAARAGEAAECARRQDGFWPMHDRIFARPKALETSDLLGHAQALGLDATKFQACLNGQASDVIKQDTALAKSLKVGGTPTFFVGAILSDGRMKATSRFEGALADGAFAKVIDGLITAVYGPQAQPIQ